MAVHGTKIILIVLMAIGWSIQAEAQESVYLDPAQPLEKRVADLISRLTTDEKISLLQFTQPAIDRLHIPAYNWWNEGLHGVARNGIATVFPQAIGMAATWNVELIGKEANVISTEARAKYNAIKSPGRKIYEGLTFWSPNINIFRDPRWGRGQETYGEDPFLTARIGVAFVRGMQGDDPRYLKCAATAKHYAVHSGPEPLRHEFDVNVSDRDLYETYLPAFEALVKEGKVEGIMGAYNRFRGDPCCANPFLLEEVLRKKWQFKGHIVSDCWALSDMVTGHKTYPSEARAAAKSLDAGLCLTCGPEFGALHTALDSGWVKTSQIDTALGYILATKFKLGMFDPPSMVPYSSISEEMNNTPEHDALARLVAEQSIVLLKNEDHVLPLSSSLKNIAIIGALAGDTAVLLGNYNGRPSQPVTFLEALRKRAGEAARKSETLRTGEVVKEGGSMTLLYAAGTRKPGEKYRSAHELEDSIQRAVQIANQAGVVIVVAGITSALEGEEGDTGDGIDGFYKGDRTNLNLPADQEQLIKALAATGKKLVVVLVNGSAIAVNWEQEHVSAILEAWYPGQQGGNAVADVLFGDFNPAGRLPVTFYRSVADLPGFSDYSMKGRTYRYFKGIPLYPFGYGLSFTRFAYQYLQTDKAIVTAGDSLQVTVRVKNTGNYDGDEVVQLYVKSPVGDIDAPVKSLAGFARIHIRKGETASVCIPLRISSLRYYDEEKKDYRIRSGKYEIQAGASSDDIRAKMNITIK